MGEQTGIQWTHHTWNPWQGCDKVSPGCDNCYMFRDMRRYGKNPDLVQLSKATTFNKPLRWNREAEKAGERRRVFLASWADFFHADADEWREGAWDIIRRCPALDFQILTKRHARIAKGLPADWGPEGYPNVWLGVSGENAEWWDRRASVLRHIPATVRFISYEPAIGPPGESAAGIDWVIIGGESGAKSASAEYRARPFDLAWARQALDVCRRDGAAPFVKQLGSWPIIDANTGDLTEALRLRCGHTIENRVAALHLRDGHGGDPEEWPGDLRVREWPTPRETLSAPTNGEGVGR